MIINLLIVLVVGSVVGAFTGLMLGGLVNNLLLAIIAGLLATFVAGSVRHIRIPQLVNIYSALAMGHGHHIPLPVVLYSAVASLAGSAAAVQVAAASGFPSAVLIATLAGFFAGILMAILIIVYHMKQPPTGRAGPS
jgi:hypothetical protein